MFHALLRLTLCNLYKPTAKIKENHLDLIVSITEADQVSLVQHVDADQRLGQRLLGESRLHRGSEQDTQILP